MADDGGLSRFQRRMNAIPVAVREAVKPALIQSGGEVAGMVERLAPVDTGALKESVHLTMPGETTPAYSQPGGSRRAGETEVLITVGDKDVRYPHLVEFGATDTAAQPFFWPAFRLTRKRAANRIKRAIGKAVKAGWSKS